MRSTHVNQPGRKLTIELASEADRDRIYGIRHEVYSLEIGQHEPNSSRRLRDGLDDFYESFYNWPLLYLLGGGDDLLTLGQRQFDATTKLGVELGHVFNEYEGEYYWRDHHA